MNSVTFGTLRRVFVLHHRWALDRIHSHPWPYADQAAFDLKTCRDIRHSNHQSHPSRRPPISSYCSAEWQDAVLTHDRIVMWLAPAQHRHDSCCAWDVNGWAVICPLSTRKNQVIDGVIFNVRFCTQTHQTFAIKNVRIVRLCTLSWELWRMCWRWALWNSASDLLASFRATFKFWRQVRAKHLVRLQIGIVDFLFCEHDTSVGTSRCESTECLNQLHPCLFILDVLAAFESRTIAIVSATT